MSKKRRYNHNRHINGINPYAMDAYKPSKIFLRLDDKMPYGKWKGIAMKEIIKTSPDYLVWVRDNTKTLLHPTLIAALEKAIQKLGAGK